MARMGIAYRGNVGGVARRGEPIPDGGTDRAADGWPNGMAAMLSRRLAGHEQKQAVAGRD